MTQPNTYWNAKVYDRINVPHKRWAQAILDELALNGDETVLDAGCGSGSVTFMLRDRLPDGRIYAVDGSKEMIAQISASISERRISNVEPIHADLTSFTLPEPVDVVFSNSVFHWIPDADALFASLFAATKPGGRLHAQFGGAGCGARAEEAAAAVNEQAPYASHVQGLTSGKYYRTPEEVTKAMEAAGWRDVKATLFDTPQSFDDPDEGANYIGTIVFREYVGKIPEAQRDAYTRAVCDEYIGRNGPPFTVDYVRMDLRARKP
jgi:trans-aconitate 2-methyltransferase